MKKKIIISTYDDLKNPYYRGGGAIAIHEVAKRMTKQFDVEVLTGNYPGAHDEIVDGVLYTRIGLSWTGARMSQLFMHVLLPVYALTRKYDMWIENFTPPFSTSCISLFTARPVIALVHMLSGEDMWRKYHLPFHFLESLGLKSYSHFIVLTEAVREKILAKNPKAHISVIGNGIDMPAESSNTSTLIGKHLSFIGRIEVDQKGLDLLIAAYHNIQKEFDIPLMIAGSGSLREVNRLKSLINSYGLSDKIKVLGFIDKEKKVEFFKSTAIGILSSRFETLPLSVLEMMSYGIPTISFDISGTRWIPEGISIKVPKLDSNQLAEAIKNLLVDEKGRNQFGISGREYAETKGWNEICEVYTTLITTILESHELKYSYSR